MGMPIPAGGAVAKAMNKRRAQKSRMPAKSSGGGGIISTGMSYLAGRGSAGGRRYGRRKGKSVGKMIQNLSMMQAVAGKGFTKSPAGQMALMKIGTKLF